MATMDIIKHYGGSPANFLDIGGGASIDEVKNGFNVLGSDDHVRLIKGLSTLALLLRIELV